MNDAEVHAHIKQLARAGDALAVKDIEFAGAEGRCYLVFYDLAFHAVAVNIVAVFELLGAAHINAHRGIEFERATARRHLGVAVCDADLFAELVYEYNDAVAL